MGNSAAMRDLADRMIRVKDDIQVASSQILSTLGTRPGYGKPERKPKWWPDSVKWAPGYSLQRMRHIDVAMAYLALCKDRGMAPAISTPLEEPVVRRPAVVRHPRPATPPTLMLEGATAAQPSRDPRGGGGGAAAAAAPPVAQARSAAGTQEPAGNPLSRLMQPARQEPASASDSASHPPPRPLRPQPLRPPPANAAQPAAAPPPPQRPPPADPEPEQPLSAAEKMEQMIAANAPQFPSAPAVPSLPPALPGGAGAYTSALDLFSESADTQGEI